MYTALATKALSDTTCELIVAMYQALVLVDAPRAPKRDLIELYALFAEASSDDEEEEEEGGNHQALAESVQRWEAEFALLAWPALCKHIIGLIESLLSTFSNPLSLQSDKRLVCDLMAFTLPDCKTMCSCPPDAWLIGEHRAREEAARCGIERPNEYLCKMPSVEQILTLLKARFAISEVEKDLKNFRAELLAEAPPSTTNLLVALTWLDSMQQIIFERCCAMPKMREHVAQGDTIRYKKLRDNERTGVVERAWGCKNFYCVVDSATKKHEHVKVCDVIDKLCDNQ